MKTLIVHDKDGNIVFTSSPAESTYKLIVEDVEYNSIIADVPANRVVAKVEDGEVINGDIYIKR